MMSEEGRAGTRLVDELEQMLSRKTAGDFTRSVDVPRLKRIAETIAAEVDLYPAFLPGEDADVFFENNGDPCTLNKETAHPIKSYLITHEKIKSVIEDYRPSPDGTTLVEWAYVIKSQSKYPVVDRYLSRAAQKYNMRTDAIFIPNRDHARWNSPTPIFWKLAKDTLEVERYIHACTGHRAVLIMVVHEIPEAIAEFDYTLTDGWGSVTRFEQGSNFETVDYNIKDPDHYVGLELANRLNGLLTSIFSFPVEVSGGEEEEEGTEGGDKENDVQGPGNPEGATLVASKGSRRWRELNGISSRGRESTVKGVERPRQQKLSALKVQKSRSVQSSPENSQGQTQPSQRPPESEQTQHSQQQEPPFKRSKVWQKSKKEARKGDTEVLELVERAVRMSVFGAMSGETAEEAARERVISIVRLSRSCLNGCVVMNIWRNWCVSPEATFLGDLSAADLGRVTGLLQIDRKVRTYHTPPKPATSSQQRFLNTIVYQKLEASESKLFITYLETSLMALIAYLEYQEKIKNLSEQRTKIALLDEMCADALSEAAARSDRSGATKSLTEKEKTSLLATIRKTLHKHHNQGKCWHELMTKGLATKSGLGLGALIMFDFVGDDRDSKMTRLDLYCKLGPNYAEFINAYLEEKTPGLGDIREVMENITLEMLGFELEPGFSTDCPLANIPGKDVEAISFHQEDRETRAEMFRDLSDVSVLS